MKDFDSAVLIGRFQPLHLGHMALLQAALARAGRVIVLLGSACQAPSPKNPFSWQERARMLHAALPPADAARVRCLPLRDRYDLARWVQEAQRAVRAHTAPGARVALVGHFKDASSDYLAHFPAWPLVRLPRQPGRDATQLRACCFASPPDWNAIAAAVPASTLAFLHQWQTTPTWARLHEEWQMLAQYRQSWAAAPWPPVFVTVDALLRCRAAEPGGGSREHILLVQRARAPGRGLWALPGGFVEPGETLWQSCLRELREETGLSLETTPARVQVFDHPGRSLRGRTITHVHEINLGDVPALPPVRGGDDAAAARWLPTACLADMEDQFLEDHFHILGCFLPGLEKDWRKIEQ